MVNSFSKAAQAIFSRLRNMEAEYNHSINMVILRYLSSLGNNVSVPAHLINLCGDKESLTTTLSTSHNIRLQVNIKNDSKIIQDS